MLISNLYNTPYHKCDLSKFKFLITGGAGFIGSNIVEYLVNFNAGHIRVVDNLSNGYIHNIQPFVGLSNFEFIKGDLRDFNLCINLCADIDYVSHQAALGSVPRSISDPIKTNSSNVDGFLNLLSAAKDNKNIKRLVYAASSSSYGDSKMFPKKEGEEGNLLSPYAVSKLVNELYADVFSRVYDFNSVGLRYFNVFGPKQNPSNAYAAVIPLFCNNLIQENIININGNGTTSRDFTFVENVVQANIKALFSDNISKHEIINVACGEETSLNQLVSILSDIASKKVEVKYSEERIGDVKRSLADISKASRLLGYHPKYTFREGLELTFNWYKNNLL